jgi:DNA repair photolyase
MQRKLYSSIVGCSNKCLYCFANFERYTKQDLFTSKEIEQDFEVVYPSCDGELTIDSDILDYVDRAKLLKNFSILSFSTKKIIPNEILMRIKEINSELLKHDRGFIKISITITNKTRIKELEPNSSSYWERLQSLQILKEYNIPSSLIIKPVLPFISDNEYFQIIDDIKDITDDILIGGLYVDTKSGFYNNYIEGKYPIERKKVAWLQDKPTWYYVNNDSKIKRIEEYISKNDLNYFVSDLDLLSSLKKNIYSALNQYVVC